MESSIPDQERRRTHRAGILAGIRLRRLSVDADECPSHVFRVTKADRLRDPFDRLGSRLYAASGQIGAKPFHHTRRCSASLRPECTAELA